MDTKEQLLAYLCDGASEPTGDGGYFVPQEFAEEIRARIIIQSRWLNLFKRIWRKVFHPKRNAAVIDLWDDSGDDLYEE